MVNPNVPEYAALKELSNVADVLHSVRTARGLSQSDICSASGMGSATVSRLESNFDYYSDALVRHLGAYAAALGYTLRFVLVHDSASAPNAGTVWQADHDREQTT